MSKKLPTKLNLNADKVIDKYTMEGIFNSINEHLADVYGFCNNGFTYDIKIKIDNIDWDMEDR